MSDFSVIGPSRNQAGENAVFVSFSDGTFRILQLFAVRDIAIKAGFDHELSIHGCHKVKELATNCSGSNRDF